MSIKTLLNPTAIINLNNLVPNTQPDGNWVGNGTLLTTLNKGLYLATLTVNFQRGAVPGLIENCLCSVYTNPASPNRFLGMPTTEFGSTFGELPKQSMANIVNIPNDNTGIYLFLSCNFLDNIGTWGLTDNIDPNLNQLIITRLDERVLSPITIPVKIFNQTTTTWTGNGTPITFLNKGLYMCIYNTTTRSSVGQIGKTQYIITKDSAYPTGEVLAGVGLTDYFVAGLNSNIVGQTISNTIYIDTDSTSIYLTIEIGLNDPLPVVWGIQTINTVWSLYYDVLYFLKIGD